MKRYLRLYITFIKNCLVRELEFRLNFVIRSLIYFLWAGLSFATIYLIMGQVHIIAGWDRDSVFLLTFVFYFSNTFYKAVFHSNLNNIPSYIRNGDMDFLLLKPINSRFLVTMRYFKFEQLPRMFLFIYLIISQTAKINPSINILESLTAVFLISFGIFSMSCLIFIISCLAFWRPRIWNLFAVVENVLNLGQYPNNIYKGILFYIITFLPIAIFATFPTRFLLGEGSLELVLLSTFIFLVFTLLSQLVWRMGLRRYESASS